jgi:hypothetical protein
MLLESSPRRHNAIDATRQAPEGVEYLINRLREAAQHLGRWGRQKGSEGGGLKGRLTGVTLADRLSCEWIERSVKVTRGCTRKQGSLQVKRKVLDMV